MIKLINQLVLDLEHIIHDIASTYGSWGSGSSERQKSLQEQHIRAKCLSFVDEFKNFQMQLRNLKVHSEAKDNQLFRDIDNCCIDELITDFMVAKDINKLIDDAHDICYKLRKLVIYLNQ